MRAKRINKTLNDNHDLTEEKEISGRNRRTENNRKEVSEEKGGILEKNNGKRRRRLDREANL